MERNFNNKETGTKQISNINLNESQLLKHESINSISDSNHTSNLNNNLSLFSEAPFPLLAEKSCPETG